MKEGDDKDIGPDSLIAMNDRGKTFLQIANLIESECKADSTLFEEGLWT
jgi:hypothetical protein